MKASIFLFTKASARLFEAPRSEFHLHSSHIFTIRPCQCYTSSCYLFQVPSITRRSFANHRNHRSAYLEHRDSTKLGRNNELSPFNLVLPALGLEGKENLCLQCDSKFFYFEFISVVRLLYILFSYGTFKEAKSRKPFERYECILVSNTQLIQRPISSELQKLWYNQPETNPLLCFLSFLC